MNFNSIEEKHTESVKQLLLCNKKNVFLYKLGENEYNIKLTSTNEHINFINIINFNIYQILGEVNTNHIESCTMIKQISKDTATFLFKFKSIGGLDNIPKKYMYVETKCNQIYNNKIEYVSSNLLCDNLIEKYVNKYEQITCHKSTLSIELLNNNHTINMEYYFNIDIHENLPYFAQDILGYMMNKMLLNLKLFIENIQ